MAISYLIKGKNKKYNYNIGCQGLENYKPITSDTFFDLASLTKPLATSLAILVLITQGKISLTDTLGELLGRTVPGLASKITLRNLLNHSSGLPAHIPYYLNINIEKDSDYRDKLTSLIINEKISEIGSSCYSDLGFILLGFIVEIYSGLNLAVFFEKEISKPLGLQNKILFRPKDRGISEFADSENCPWRKKIIRGEVHDQNSWAIGGISGQAGLFASAETVWFILDKLMAVEKNRYSFENIDSDLLLMAMQKDGNSGSSWGLGFDTPSLGKSSAGQYISTNSCGHLGFTGTSFWLDFNKEIIIILLTNRINSRLDQKKIKEFRPLFHDLVFKTISDNS